MNFLSTSLGSFLWKTIMCLLFIGIMWLIVKSANASWKRTGKIYSIFDEIIEGVVVLIIFMVIVANDATTVLGWIQAPLMWILDMIKAFFREVLGIPL